MVNKHKLMNDLVEVMVLENLAPKSTVADMIRWFDYAIDMNIVEYEYFKSELIAFMDWVRIPRIPVSMEDARQLFHLSPGGPVGVAVTAYVSELAPTGTLRKLISRAWNKNQEGVTHVCFHRRKGQKFVILKNIRRQSCKETVGC